ncbi:hypothetical protein GCM10023185_39020 [Hymenobacter saemangeumensis]|uniref:STAS/SEC14 domain-containing protein n=1 Tax=Hymenobacter saemangeumensis TaxID=1084522 RepID=A0ABP8IQM9_9BACT
MKREINNAFGKTFLTIEYDTQHHFVYNNWLGYQTRESIVTGANICIDVLTQHRCPYLLNDNRMVTGPWDHAVDWIANDWTPRAIAIGLTHFAHVVSPESFAALSAEMMHSSVGDSFQMRIFGSMPEAKAWLYQAQQVMA